MSLAIFSGAVWGQTPDVPATQAESPEAVPAQAWQVVTLANEARKAAGLKPLDWDTALALAARQHCERMAAEGLISHRYEGEPDLSERAAQAGAHFSLVEENIAFAETPAAVHEGWMRSPAHRENLLSPDVDHVGVGWWRAERCSTLWPTTRAWCRC